MNIKPTVEAIRTNADVMRYASGELLRVANMIEEKQDVVYVGQALTAITCCLSALRLDLLAMRPISALKGDLLCD